MSGLQRPASRIGKTLQKPVSSGVGAGVSSAPTLSNVRSGDRRMSVSSTSSGITTPVNANTPVKRDPSAATAALTVGDTVAIPGGNKGQLMFLGETDFAKGEWAGVYLDEGSGKNDGSVEGKSYFTCPDKHGIFIRPNKLTKCSDNVPQSATTSTSNTSKTPNSNRPLATPLQKTVETPSRKISAPDSTSSQRIVNPMNSQPNFGPAQPVQMRVKTPLPGAEGLSAADLKEGEPVWVNGIKQGTVAFVGETEFASGVWVGIILGDQSGKNDGSVNGKRYFTCEMGFGLFSPISKVTKEPKRPPSAFQTQQRSSALSIATPASQRPASAVVDPRLRQAQQQESAAKRRGSATSLLQRDKLGGSSGSVSSIGSTASANKFNGMFASGGSGGGGASSSMQQLQMALREAEVRESQLRVLVDQSDKNKLELDRLLEEERRKVEDLHFRIEEETILKGDLMNEKNMLKHQLENLENSLRDTQDQLEEMKKKYSDLEFQMAEQSLEDADSGVSLNSNVAGNVLELEESLKDRDSIIASLRCQLESLKLSSSSVKEQLTSSQSVAHSLSAEKEEIAKSFDEMKQSFETKNSRLAALESEVSELRRQQITSEEQLRQQADQVQSLKHEKLDLEKTIEGFANTSGDADSQMSVLHAEIKNNQGTIQKLKQEIESFGQDKVELLSQAEIAKQERESELNDLNRAFESKLTQSEQRCSQLQAELTTLQEQLKSCQEELKDVNVEKGLLQKDLQQFKEYKETLGEENEGLKRAIESLQQADGENRSRLESLVIELESLKTQNESLNRKLKEAESFRDEFASKGNMEQENSELKSELSKLQLALEEKHKVIEDKETKIKSLENISGEKSQLETEIFVLREQNETIMNKLSESNSAREEQEAQLEKIRKTLEFAESEANEHRSRVEALIEDYTNLESELAETREKLKAAESLTEQNSRLKRNVTELNEKISAKELSILQYKESNSKYKAELDVAVKKIENTQSLSSGEVNLQIKVERDSLQKQVDFLNSVIVDLNNKNEYLSTKVNALAGFEVHNPASNDSYLDDDSPVKNFTHNLRMFCDICDEFDLHNTEECPKMTSRAESPGSKNRGNITEPRPYCEVCDCFDHWAEDCDDDQMF